MPPRKVRSEAEKEKTKESRKEANKLRMRKKRAAEQEKNASPTLGKMQLRHWRQYLSGKNPLWKFHGCHRIFRTLSCLDQRASSSKICRKIVPQSRALTTLKIFRPTGKSDILPNSLPRIRFFVGFCTGEQCPPILIDNWPLITEDLITIIINEL